MSTLDLWMTAFMSGILCVHVLMQVCSICEYEHRVCYSITGLSSQCESDVTVWEQDGPGLSI